MRQRSRKFVGAIVIILYVIVYALVAMALAQARLVQDAHGLVQGLVYVLLGTIWILPLMPLISWMERPDKA
jgi:hypothetical protein